MNITAVGFVNPFVRQMQAMAPQASASPRFGTQMACDTALVEVNSKSPPSQAYVHRVARATQRALGVYPPAIRKALLDAGFKVVVSRRNGETIDRLDQVFSPSQAFEYHVTMQDHGQFVPRLVTAFANLPSSGNSSALMEKATEQTLLSFLRPELDEKPAFVGHQPPVVYLAETISGPRQTAWQHYTRSTRRLAHVILHESGHIMDVALGAARTGRPYSQSPAFKSLLLADLRETPPHDPYYAGIRRPNRMGEDGSSYFPIEGATDQKLGESFAEITAARYGQGALRRDDVLHVFSRHTLPYLQQQVWNQIALAT